MSLLLNVPPELYVQIFTFLRADDLSKLHKTCSTFNDPKLIHSIIDTFANVIYPQDLSQGFDSPIVGGELSHSNENSTPKTWTSFEVLRNMEMLVVARILSRPEPPKSKCGNCYYVSKSWCRAALKWLDVQAEERKHREQEKLEAQSGTMDNQDDKKKRKHKPKKKQTKKQQRKQKQLSAKLNNTPAPSDNPNHDIICEHGRLQYCGTNTASANTTHGNARGSKARRLLDKQAWKILKKLYPNGAQLSHLDGECVQCAMEAETEKKNRQIQKQREAEERKLPLSCPLVRGFYSRRTGVPKESLVFHEDISVAKSFPKMRNGNICPLKVGVYNVIPKTWCHRWRKYIKNGDGGKPPAPDTSSCLCDGHRLPLVPPHLKAFLCGENINLMDTVSHCEDTYESQDVHSRSTLPVGFSSPTARRLQTPSNTFTTPPRERMIAGERVPLQQNNSRTPDQAEISQMRALGLPESEIQLQRLAMMRITEQRLARQEQVQERQRQDHDILSPEESRAKLNSQLDRENKVVVEILTDEELHALEKWWHGIHSCYAMKFAIVELDQGIMDIVWTTAPCNQCDASGKVNEYDFSVRNRNRALENNSAQKKRFGKKK